MDLSRIKDRLLKFQEKFDPNKIKNVNRIRDIKRPWLRRLIVAIIVVISVSIALFGSFQAEEAYHQKVRDEYVSTVNNQNKVANWSVIKNFKMKNGDTAGIFSYQNENGFNILIYNITKKEVISSEVIDTKGGDVSNSSTILAAQLILYLLENEKDFTLDKIEKIDGVGFNINDKEYKLENQYSRLTSINGTELTKLYNVHLTQPAEKRLLQKAGLSNYDDLLIGRIEKISDSEVVITARDKNKHDVYEFHTTTDNKVKLITISGISGNNSENK